MKAVVCDTLSADFSGTGIRDVPAPDPEAGEVLIRVHATGINFPDLLLCQGLYQLKPPLPFSPGMDVAGEVTAVGDGVDRWKVGDLVAGSARIGSFADYVRVPANQIRAKPDALTMAQAAGYQVAYLTAWVALVRRANLQAGEVLLVHGASGGTGLAAVDIGKALGATVIATSSKESKLSAVLAAGADHGLLVQKGFRQPVKDLTQGRGADVIFDPVGGDVFDESVRCIAFDGRLLVVGFTSGRIADVSTNMPLIKGFSVVGVRAGEYGRQFPDRGQENLDSIWSLAAEGRTVPRVHAERPLEDFRDGFSMLQKREVVGKVVLTLN